MTRALWAAVITLAIIGVVAATGRAMFLDDLATRLAPAMVATGVYSIPDPAARMQEVRDMDREFATHRLATVMHIIPGGAFLLLAPLQFLSTLRRRRLNLHRRLGRVLVIAAIVAGGSALFFGLVTPFGGVWERPAAAFAGGWLLFSMTAGYLAIRRKDQRAHRRWMIRGFAVALAVALIRVIDVPLGVWLIPSGATVRGVYLLSLWLGFSISCLIAELWIRYAAQPLTEPTMIPAM